MSDSLNSGRVPSLRRRLLVLVSMASLIIVVLATWQSDRRARHEVEELMDDQLAKTALLMLADAQQGGEHLIRLPARLSGARGLQARRNGLTLEFQIGRPDGTVLARSAQAPTTPLSGKLGFSTVVEGDHPWRSLILETADGTFRIQVAESIPKRDREAREIARKTVKPLWFVFPLLLVAIYFSVRRGLKPLDDLARDVADRSSDNLAPLASRSTPREAQPLVAAINRLLFRLGSSLENERRFTADAAHELRTPLAAARIQAQVALLSADAAPRKHALAQTMAGLDRATRLVEQLLRLARLDSPGRLPASQMTDLAELARRVAAGVQDASPQVRIGLELDAGEPRVEVDADLLEIALRNLIDNAIRYSPAQSEITVFLRADDGGLVLGVSDNGPGVAPEDLPRLRERFFRSAQVTAEGCGLGLTIVGRIAELHGATLDLANREGGGFTASLRWAR